MENKKCPVCSEDMDPRSSNEDLHGHKVQINNLEYTYSPFYDRLQIEEDSEEKSVVGCIRCVRCHNDSFRISYGDYECIANCVCGHSFTIYEG